MPISPDLTNTILIVLEVALAIIGGFVAALWISLVIWAFRDIRSRSRDVFAQLLATLLVLIFNVPGLLLYMLLRPPERLAEAYERALEEEALLQDIEERLLCPGCKRQVKEDFIICPSCHTSLKRPCVNCGRILHLKWDVCPYCATVQMEAVPSTAVRDVNQAKGVFGRGRQSRVDHHEPLPTAPDHTPVVVADIHEGSEPDAQEALWLDGEPNSYSESEDDEWTEHEAESRPVD